MTIAHINGINLYYEVHGNGPKLVLIEGLGYHSWMWYKQIPAFSQHFQTLIYDNRGVGRSEAPEGPYDHVQNADDLAGLLDHLGWESAHVLGVSMGGFIAQEFALKYAQRVDKLVLAATAFGGPNMIPIPRDAALALAPNPRLSADEKIRSSMPIAFGDQTWPQKHVAEFEQIIQWRLECVQSPQATMAQLMAGVNFNTEARLHGISASTLVIAGSLDRVVPPQNAAMLAQILPHARLVLMPDAGHLLFIEQAEQFNAIVLRFLGE